MESVNLKVLPKPVCPLGGTDHRFCGGRHLSKLQDHGHVLQKHGPATRVHGSAASTGVCLRRIGDQCRKKKNGGTRSREARL